jgi:hypothetical protein
MHCGQQLDGYYWGVPFLPWKILSKFVTKVNSVGNVAYRTITRNADDDKAASFFWEGKRRFVFTKQRQNLDEVSQK